MGLGRIIADLLNAVDITGFNNASQLVQLDSSGNLNSVDYREWFGNGYDGDQTFDGTTAVTLGDGIVLTPVAGVYTLPNRSLFFNNLTINGTASLRFDSIICIYVAGILDITAAPANAIYNVGAAGGNAVGTAAGAQATNLSVADGIQQIVGMVGKSGGTAAGTQGTAVTNNAGSYKVQALFSIGGKGGDAGANLGGAIGAATCVAIVPVFVYPNKLPLTLAGLSIPVTRSGPGAGSGAGDGTAGGGSGAGGNAGISMCIFAKTINRGAGTTAGCIVSNGGTGGNGGVPAGGNRGGGGGGGGGVGGHLWIGYNSLTGAQKAGALVANGGTGGTGGDGTGTAYGGDGGSGGPGGAVSLLNLNTKVVTSTYGVAGSAGSAGAVTAGGGGGAGATLSVDL